MKKFFSLFLVMILILNFVSFSYADTVNTIDRLIDVNPDAVISVPEPSTPPETDDEDPDFGSEGAKPRWGIFEPIISLIEDILAFLPSMVLRIIYLIPTLDGIIFNTNRLFSITLFDTVVPADTSDAADAAGTASTGDAAGTATETIKSGSVSAYLQSSISAVYNAFRYLVTAVYIVVLVYLAIRMMLSSVGRQKAKYKELFKYWLIGLLLLFSFHWVMAGVIWLSNTIVEILYKTTISMMSSTTVWEEVSKVSHFSATHYNQSPITDYIFYEITHFLGTVAEIGLVASVFGWALVFAVPILALVFAIMLIRSAFSIIITYFKRLFTILVLVLLFPIVVLSYVFDKIGDRKAQTLSIWIKEFVTNVMIQPIHALILTFIGIMFAKASSSLLLNNAFFGPIFCLLALRLIPMGEELLKKLFQISSQMGPGSHGIAGSVAQAGLALRGMREMGGALKSNFSNIKDLRNLRKQHGIESSFKTATKGAALFSKGEDGKLHLNSKDQRGLNGARAALSSRNNEEYKRAYEDYKKAVKKKTNSKNMVGALAKTYAPAAGVAYGIGGAITSAGSGQFLSKAATNAAIAGSAAGAIAKAPGAVDKFIHGDDESAKQYEKLLKKIKNTDLDSMDSTEKKRISTLTGIPESALTEANRARLELDINAMATAARFGAPSDKVKDFTSYSRQKKLIEDGLMPDGSGATFDKSLFTNVQRTKDGYTGEYNGQRYYIGGKGSEDDLVDFNNPTKWADAKKAYDAASTKVNTAEIELSDLNTTHSELVKARDKAKSRGNTEEATRLQHEININSDKISSKKTEIREAKLIRDDTEKTLNSLIDADIDYHTKFMGEAAPEHAESAVKLIRKDPSKGSYTISGVDSDGNIDYSVDPRTFTITYQGQTFTTETPRNMLNTSQQLVADYYAANEALATADTTLTAAQNNLQLAVAQNLSDPGSVSAADVAVAQTAYDQAQAAYDQARLDRRNAGERIIKRNPNNGNISIDGRSMIVTYKDESYTMQTPDYMLDSTQRVVAEYDDATTALREAETDYNVASAANDTVAMNNANLRRIEASEQQRLAAYKMVVQNPSKGSYIQSGNNYTVTVNANAEKGQQEETFSIPVVNPASVEQAQHVIYQSVMTEAKQEKYVELRDNYISAIESEDAKAINTADRALNKFINETSKDVSDTFNAYTANPSSAPANTTDFGPSLDLRGLFTSIAANPNTPTPAFTASMIDSTLDEDLFASGACTELSDFLKDTSQKLIILQKNVANIVISIKEFGVLKPVKEIYDVSTLTMEAIFGDSDDPVTIFFKDGRWYIKEK